MGEHHSRPWRRHRDRERVVAVRGRIDGSLAEALTSLFLEVVIAEARDLVAGGSSPSEAAKRVAGATGVSRRSIYQALIEDQDTS